MLESASTNSPKVSIGLAVYNGETFLAEAIESILAQTYHDFELIISDNASTDQTAQICQKYAAQDKRIRYHRNKTNIGGANNENLTLTMAKGKYVRLAAHDDKCAPELIERMVNVLDSNADVILCYTTTNFIDESNTLLGVSQLGRGMAKHPHQRFGELIFRNHSCEPTYGLIRAETLRKIELQRNYTDSDRIFLGRLALHGRFYEIPEPLFYKRFHAKNTYLDWRARMAWFNPSWKGKISLPHWLQFVDGISTIRQAPISLYEKLCCYLVMILWLMVYGKNMAKDLFVAFWTIIHSSRWRSKDSYVYNWE
ncbi:MAG TPA: glycosyltransferase [Caldilineaceae bacterium]|nr:glycosyltransferase [Caldilineaceae bacterium]